MGTVTKIMDVEEEAKLRTQLEAIITPNRYQLNGRMDIATMITWQSFVIPSFSKATLFDLGPG